LNVAAHNCASRATDSGTDYRASRAAYRLADCSTGATTDRTADDCAGPSFTTLGGYCCTGGTTDSAAND
jgi:hypothetical protein